MLTKWVLPVIIPLSYIRERDGNITTSITSNITSNTKGKDDKDYRRRKG